MKSKSDFAEEDVAEEEDLSVETFPETKGPAAPRERVKAGTGTTKDGRTYPKSFSLL